MSDFLSNFNKDNYQDTEKKRVKRKKISENNDRNDFEIDQEVQPTETVTEETKELPETEPETRNVERKEEKMFTRSEKNKTHFAKVSESSSEKPVKTEREKDEETEFDPSYKRKQLIKRGIIGAVILLIGIVLFFIYYQFTHVKMQDFVGEDVSEARTWLAENDLKLELVQEFDEKKAANEVLSQKQKANKNIKKGSTVQVVASKGPDPDKVLEMPDFMAISKAEAEQWKDANRAENLTFIEEYNDTEEKGKPLRVEFNNKDITRETYRRKEKAKVYYSKGKETFEKTIVVPDFVNKPKTELESWAKTNEIKVNYQEESSDGIALDSIISQSIAKDEKVAKRDEMTVTVSLGKGITVPNFGDFTAEEAASAAEGLGIQVKSIYTENVAYGVMVSQSVEAGRELTSKDSTTVKVVYSLGKPYIKDLRGSYTEGDLPKYFYDEYQSKGANINHQVRYVDSAETKGTVVGMSAMNQYLPLQYTVYLDISKGNLQGEPEYPSQSKPVDE